MKANIKLYFTTKFNAMILGMLIGLVLATISQLYLGYLNGMDKPTLTQVSINIFVMSFDIYVMNKNYHKAKMQTQNKAGELKK